MAEYRLIPLELIDEPPTPVRAAMDSAKLEELAEDIRLNGVIEPLIVTPKLVLANSDTVGAGDQYHIGEEFHIGRWVIWAGHRRLLAARMAFLREVPCIIRSRDELPSEAVMLSENLCREDLSAAEIGWFVLELVEKFHLSMDELCRRLRRSEDWIQQRVDLVQKDAEVAKAVAARQINFAVARELLKCGDEQHRRYLLRLDIEHGCTARTVTYQVAQWKEGQSPALTARPTPAAPEGSPAVPAVDLTPHCVLCGVRDAPQNLVQVLFHYYHWNPVKKFLRDSGVEIHEAPQS